MKYQQCKRNSSTFWVISFRYLYIITVDDKQYRVVTDYKLDYKSTIQNYKNQGAKKVYINYLGKINPR